MPTSQNTSNPLKRVLATLSFFTRLPLWRLMDIPGNYYERVVPLWPLAGWVTGGLMVGVFVICSIFLPTEISILFAIISRILLTGALHDDGFADFCDGFGGGRDRESTLRIMKDSHIGTYGVIGLIFQYTLLAILMYHLFSAPSACAPIAILCADSASKWAASNIINVLPYARTASEAKNRLVYSKMTLWERIIGISIGILPTALFLPPIASVAILTSLIASCFMFIAMRIRIKGYTGDCCGATFVVAELTYLATLLILFSEK